MLERQIYIVLTLFNILSIGAIKHFWLRLDVRSLKAVMWNIIAFQTR